MKRLPPMALADAAGKINENLAQFLPHMQVFDFGELSSDAFHHVDSNMTAELWSKKLLRLPFRYSLFMFKSKSGMRIYLPIIDDCDIVIDDAETVSSSTLFGIISQHSDSVLRADAQVWFRAEPEHSIRIGAVATSDVEDETDESFKTFTQSAVGQIMRLCMALNTKGVPLRHEPAPVALNKKRARSGKLPLSAVTYVDISRLSISAASKRGASKSMHYRRGHIRHYDDGSVSWIRDCIVKADGELKKRERYQVRMP